MKGARAGRRWSLAAAALGLALISHPLPIRASNAGYYFPIRIQALGRKPQGWNLVTLPERSAYQGTFGLNKLCADLKLDPDGQIIQLDGQGKVLTHVCSMASPQFNLLAGRGVIVQNPRIRDGVLVGSDDPTRILTIFNSGKAPLGVNVVPIDYDTTLTTPQDLCQSCALSNTASVSRIDALTGMVMTHACGQIPGWSLVQGEAVLVVESQGTRTCVPPHL